MVHSIGLPRGAPPDGRKTIAGLRSSPYCSTRPWMMRPAPPQTPALAARRVPLGSRVPLAPMTTTAACVMCTVTLSGLCRYDTRGAVAVRLSRRGQRNHLADIVALFQALDRVVEGRHPRLGQRAPRAVHEFLFELCGRQRITCATAERLVDFLRQDRAVPQRHPDFRTKMVVGRELRGGVRCHPDA